MATDGELSYGSVMTVDLLSLSDYVDVYRRRYIEARDEAPKEKDEEIRDKTIGSFLLLLSGEFAYAVPISYSQRLIKYSEHSRRAKNMIQ